MKVLAGAMGLVVVLTLTVAAGAFAQMTGDGSTNNVSTHNNGTDPQSTDPTPPPPPEEPTTPPPPAPPAPAADCPSEIEGMNTVLTALPEADRTALGAAGQLPAIPCDGYHHAADFTIVADTPASLTVPQSPEQTTETV